MNDIIEKTCLFIGCKKTDCKNDYSNFDYYYTSCKNNHIVFHDEKTDRFTVCDEKFENLFYTTNEVLALLLLTSGANDIYEFFENMNDDIY